MLKLLFAPLEAGLSFSKQASTLESSERQPLPPHRDNHPIAFLISFFLHIRRERDGAHDAIPKLLIHDRLVRVPVVLHYFVQPIDERLAWWHGYCTAPVGHAVHRVRQSAMLDV